MCRAACGLLVAISAWVGGGTASAQDTLVARLRGRADSLAQAWRQADALADLVDSLERERAGEGRDTIAVGALRIVTNASPLPVRQAAARAWPIIDSMYGSVAADLARRPYLIHAVDPDTAVRRSVFHAGMEVPWDLDEASVVTLLLSAVPIAPPDPALADWLGTSLRPALRGPHDRAAAYVQLVTAPSQAARGCFLGDVGRCEDALGLGAAAGALERWYPSAEERHALVTRAFADYFNRGATAATFRACAAGNDADCSELLGALPGSALPKPLASDARATLVHLALSLGGRDAYRRLLMNPTSPMAERLAAAAGTPVDSLVARWRAQVIASRPTTVLLPVWAFAVALGWTAVFAVCGLWSSRWRTA
jgi:hypothetical protein